MLHSFNKVSLIPKKVIKEIIRENTLKKLIFKNPHVKKIKTHTEVGVCSSGPRCSRVKCIHYWTRSA